MTTYRKQPKNTTMKKVIIKNYIQGLASFLDENDIQWEGLPNQGIAIYFNNLEELFLIGYKFGCFYSEIEN